MAQYRADAAAMRTQILGKYILSNHARPVLPNF